MTQSAQRDACLVGTVDTAAATELFFRNSLPPLELFMGEAAESRLTQLHEGTPGLAWWRDRAVRRKSTSGASATGPVSRRATSAPSHRADEPPGPQAPGKQARLIHTDRTDRSGRGARMQCPGASVLCLSPPLVALLLTRLAIRSGQSHPGLYTHSHQPDSG